MNASNLSCDIDIYKILKENPLFNGLSAQQLFQLEAMMIWRTCSHGEYVFHEGDLADELYILVSGEVEIFKEESESKNRHHMTTMQSGASIGEVAILDGKPRSASVRASGDCELLALRIENLQTLHTHEDSIYSHIRGNMGGQLAKNFRNLNELTVQALQEQLTEARARVTSGVFVITTFVFICAYVFVLQIAAQLIHSKVDTSVLSIPCFVAFFLLFLTAVKRSGQPFANFGVNTTNWKIAVQEACIYSVPLMMLAVFAKWMLIKFHPGMQGDELFVFMHKIQFGTFLTLIEVAVYVLFTPLQEFIVRGVIQGTFEDFLTDKHRVLKSILIANLIFSMLHLYMSVLFAVMVFIPGLVWGWLYSRQRTLVGVSLSHALVGLFAFFVVGFDTLIEIYG